MTLFEQIGTLTSLICCVFVLLVNLDSTQGNLDHILDHYDTLHHRDIRHHHVNKRSTESGRNIADRTIEFDTLGKHFHLHLTTNKNLFAQDFKAVEIHGDGDRLEKTVINLDQSEFFVGTLEGEPSSHVEAYYEEENLVVSIKTRDDTFVVEPSWRHFNGSHDFTMISYRASDIKIDRQKHPEGHTSHNFCGYVNAKASDGDSSQNPQIPGYTYDKERNKHHRYKRQAISLQVCPVVLVADYHFFENVGDSNKATTSKYLAGVLARVNAIYEATDFGNGYSSMGFSIKEIQVYSAPTETPQFNQQKDNWGTEELLRSFGLEDWSDACLAHLFTYIGFDGGVQGLAWVASSRSNEVGGVCSPVYQNTNYNTAWTSNLNAVGGRILAQEADLVTAHEFGHNWGSPHDPSNCAPSTADGGKYLMYQYSVSGYDPNNQLFSECSRSSINSVLQAKSSICFQERTSGVCGNGQVEGEEQCDAGPAGDDCCTASCMFTDTAVCSDANSVCCASCQFAPSTFVCRNSSSESSCDGVAICTGSSAECPASSSRTDGSPCLDQGKCRGGVCLPLCEFNNLTSCTCDEQDTACLYCCKADTSSACQPFMSDPKKPNGRSCYAGVCDAQGQCNKVEVKNTARIWDIIRDLDGNAILEWMRNNIVVTVIVLSLIIYIPFCIAVWCLDRKNRKHDEEHRAWMSRTNDKLEKPGSNNNIRRTQPRRRQGTGGAAGFSRLS